ncbi:MAG: hypothetical protein ABIL40_09405 [candidate division WOR-3 bacterium]
MIITKITNLSHIFLLVFFALKVLFANGENCVEHIYKTLERMNDEERNNSVIKFLFESDESYGTKLPIKTIEELWNSGNYESAINQFSKIEPFITTKDLGLEIHWKEPIKTKSDNRWAQDIRIGNRDSVYAVAFDVHRATGNLFVIALCRDGSNSGWSVNYSTNGGSTWYERYYYTYPYHIKTLSAAIVANHCYVCFSRPAAQNQAYLYRFRATDAQRDSFSNGSYYVEVFSVTSPDSIDEIVLIGDQDDTNTRLYCGAIINDGVLRLLWDDPEAISWSSIATGIADADRGIDICKNVGFSHYWMLISYIDFNHRLRIYGLGYGIFESISNNELIINSGGKDE